MLWKALDNGPGFGVKKTLTLVQLNLLVLPFTSLCLKVINIIVGWLKKDSMC